MTTFYQVTWPDTLKNTREYVELKVFNDAGVNFSESKITMEEFFDCLKDSTHETKVEEVEPIDNEILPRNCIKQVWINPPFEDFTGIQDIFLEIRKGRWNIQCYDTLYEDVGFPRMIFCYRIDGSQVTSLSVVALKEHCRITSETKLFKFPFANVFGGKVCMGGNSFPKLKALYELETMHNFFFGVPFSGDHYTNRNTSGIADLRELFKSLEGKEFPEEWLLSKQRTFNEFFTYKKI